MKKRTINGTLAQIALWGYLITPLALQPVFMSGRGWGEPLYLFNALTSVMWVGLLYYLPVRPFFFHLFAAPLYLLSTVDLFLLLNFKNRLSSGYIGIALTDHAEAPEFLASFFGPVLAVSVVLLLIYSSGLFLIRSAKGKAGWKPSLICASVLLLAYTAQLANGYRNEGAFRVAALDVLGKEMSSPMGGIFQTSLALILSHESKLLLEKRNAFSFTGVSTKKALSGKVMVWIIGESSRPQNWGLMGYSRDTTPRLQAIKGVIPLPDLLATAPATSIAVPSMLSLRPIAEWDQILSERSIISVFNQAGFKTYWLSAQEADGWAGLIPQVAAEARRRRYFDRAYDVLLVDELRRILENEGATESLMIVLHTKGSHWRFDRRYPREFEKFKAGVTAREKLVDQYDNSVLYTDWIIAEAIRTLEARPAESAVFFVSDHGENLLDDENELFGHALGNQYDLPAAGLVWLSSAMVKRNQQEYANLQKNSRLPLSVADLSHSFLDIAGIDVDGLNTSQSLFRPNFSVRERWFRVRDELKKEEAPTP